jgi:hypothetical protein
LYGSAADLYSIPELKSIFENAFINEWTVDELLRQVDNTDWAKSRTNAQESYDIQKTVNPTEAAAKVDANIALVRRVLSGKGLTVGEDQVRAIAEKGTRDGWDGNQWDEYTASEAINYMAAGGGQIAVAGQPSAGVSVTPTASDLRKIAKDFGVTVSDNVLNQYVADISTNRATPDQFTEYVRQSAQTLYPSLSERLKTANFEQIVAPYKNLYSQVLEVPEENVDLTSPAMSPLFSGPDPEKPRMMTSTEWVAYLRKKPEWQNTQNAYREYSEVAATLNKIFGGTR